MKKKLVVAGLTVMLGLSSGIGVAGAHTVGEPGTPNCHGSRVSHGSSDHDLTPKERAAGLTEFINAPGLPPFLQEFADFARSLFGDEVSVKEYHEWVRLNCSGVGAG